MSIARLRFFVKVQQRVRNFRFIIGGINDLGREEWEGGNYD